MAGLGAGAGAAARIEFEEKLAEEQRQADMRAAQSAAALREQSRQFDERQRAALEERDYGRRRQSMLDERQRRLDEFALEDRSFQRGRAERADARQQRLDERQDRLDALALEERDYRRGRDTAADARQSRLDERQRWLDDLRSEGQRIANDTARAKYDELTRLLDEQQMKRENLRATISGAERSIVRFLVENPGLAQKDSARFADFLALANNQLGTKFSYMGLMDNGGIYAESPALDENGKQILDDVKDGNGNVVGRRKRMTPFFIAPEKVREVAGSEGFDWDNMTKSYAARDTGAMDAAKLRTEAAKAALYGARAQALNKQPQEGYVDWTPSEVGQIIKNAESDVGRIDAELMKLEGDVSDKTGSTGQLQKAQDELNRLGKRATAQERERAQAKVDGIQRRINDLYIRRQKILDDADALRRRGKWVGTGKPGGGSSFSRALGGGDGGAQGGDNTQDVKKWFIDDMDDED